jgi:hypothetical protein
MQCVLQVPLDRGVDQWLAALQVSVADTISNLLVQVAQDINNSLPCEDWALKVNIMQHSTV